MRKLRSIEMLRAIAALLVILFHIDTVFGVQLKYSLIRDIINGGHRGVDLFFVLSGFIIAHVHANDLNRPARLSNYLFNRISRIYPSVWIMSALAILVYGFGPNSTEKMGKLAPLSIISSFLLLPQQGVPLVNVTWTLTYEIFFYALFAVLIVNFRFGAFLLIVWQSSIILVALLDLKLGFSGYFMRILCLDFVIGLICAWLVQRNWVEFLPSGIWLVLLAAGVFCFIIGMHFDATINWATLSCALGSGLIIISLVRLEQMRAFHIPDLLVVIGGASYAIYLVHFSAIHLISVLLRRLGVPSSDVFYFIYVTVGVVSGLAFDQLVDKPIQLRLRLLRNSVLRTNRSLV